jgi:hypothetical protein
MRGSGQDAHVGEHAWGVDTSSTMERFLGGRGSVPRHEGRLARESAPEGLKRYVGSFVEEWGSVIF